MIIFSRVNNEATGSNSEIKKLNPLEHFLKFFIFHLTQENYVPDKFSSLWDMLEQ